LLIAPATGNTVAKIATGIADTLLTNSAIMALKAFVPVYIMPCDYKEGVTVTRIPDGGEMKIRVRKEDVENVKTIATMDGIHILERPEEIKGVFQKYFKP
jgi:flavoprotein